MVPSVEHRRCLCNTPLKTCTVFCFLFFTLCSARAQTLGFEHARQTFSHWTTKLYTLHLRNWRVRRSSEGGKREERVLVTLCLFQNLWNLLNYTSFTKLLWKSNCTLGLHQTSVKSVQLALMVQSTISATQEAETGGFQLASSRPHTQQHSETLPLRKKWEEICAHCSVVEHMCNYHAASASVSGAIKINES